ncbi:hypothetical protein HELRODRAFT_160804 [Helobdella robusta]|uniref:Apple domain-containing protein n=1 Tax=Helobdella robusta TaxID=6412 RepID=T1EQQ8_HELRO|nr:hypothetical protein HELRODRAFT_160804 [Helobdella robusta]ESO06614.1 hypothetical protein HELRODRAFT_160804 [Helobdella robusta]
MAKTLPLILCTYLTSVIILAEPFQKICWDKLKNKTFDRRPDENVFMFTSEARTVHDCKKKCILNEAECEYVIFQTRQSICFFQINSSAVLNLQVNPNFNVYHKKDCSKKVENGKVEGEKEETSKEKIDRDLDKSVVKHLECISEVFENVAKSFADIGGNLASAAKELSVVASKFEVIGD